uniref:SET domain-containing protein n=1 Tax=Alexandrium catenella TaxID=2925 RepID=A0A7S1MFF4_ALECA
MAPDSPVPGELRPLASWWAKHDRASVRLAAKLAYEQQRLGPYLAMLPELEAIQAPWRWREEELRFVSPDVAERARARREALEAAAADLEALDCWKQPPRELFFRANHAVTSRAFSGRDQAFAGGPSDAVSLGLAVGAALTAAGAATQGLISLEAGALGAVIIAAASAVASATLGSREVLSVLPMVDQVNHASGPLPDLVLTNSSSRCWELRAHRKFGQGEEVVFSYGEKDNDTLLLQHGFVEEDNPSDAFGLDVDDDLQLSEATRSLVEDRDMRKLRFERRGAAMALAPSPDSDGFRPVDFPEAALAEVADAAVRRAVQAADSGGLSEAQDAAALATAQPSARGELIVRWRRERRRILAEAAARWLK